MLSIAAACLVSFVPPVVAAGGAGGAGERAPFGRYVEARTATVFAGACHYAGEATTDGREALLVWHFDGGASRGVDLSGVNVAVALVGARNLADAPDSGATRHAIAFVDAKASLAQRDAALALVRDALGEALGTLDEVRPAALEVAFEGDAYRAVLDGSFRLSGSTLPDRACCKMPYQVWYRPFVALDAPLVGRNDEFRCDDRRAGRSWSRPGENASFTGHFDLAPAAGPVAAVVASPVRR